MRKIKYKQQDITDCGATCLASLLSFYGKKFPIAQIRQYAGTSQRGTNLLGMIQAAEKLGLLAKAIKVAQKDILLIPTPCIAHLNIKNKWQHFVVIYKIKKKAISIMDPAVGRIEKWSYEKFFESWTGITLIASPGKHFISDSKEKSIYKEFLNLIKPHKSIIFQSLTGAILFSLLGISTSIYVEKLIDYVIPSGSENLLVILSIVLILIIALRTFIGYFKNLLILKTGQKIDAMLVLGYYRHLLKLPKFFFDTMRTGEIISRVNDAVKIRNFINNVAIDFIVNILIVVITLIVMTVYSIKIAVIVFASIPVYFLFYHLYNKLNKNTIRQTMENSAELESSLVESINAADTIKRFGIEKRFTSNTDQSFVKVLKSSYAVNKNSLIIKNVSDLFSALILITVFWLGTKEIFQNNLSTGELLSFYTLYNYLSAPIAALLMSNRNVQDALIAADRLFQIMNLEQEKFPKNNLDLNKLTNNSLEFKNVYFRYPGQLFELKNINIKTHGGKISAFIGESGSGKSTIFSLIQKVISPAKGIINVSDIDIDSFPKEIINSKIGLVPQNIILFKSSILRNITLSDDTADITKLYEIVDLLGMRSFIESLPGKLNTMVEENGENLSGGEKQKIAIARTLYHNPDIILFDEASSALDSHSEYYLKQLTLQLKEQNKNVILIAHRLVSIIHADIIYVLKNGEIIESGSHQSLLKNKKEYSKLWSLQNSHVFS